MSAPRQRSAVLLGEVGEIERSTDAEVTAAVACVVAGCGPEAEVLLIERARRRNDPWSGQLAFPGGRVQPEDASPLETAIRETEEEVGLALEVEELVGRLDDQAPMSGRHALRIAVFVFELAAPPDELVPNHEVADAFWVPLRRLLDPERSVPYRWKRLPDQEFPAIAVDPVTEPTAPGRVVWGLTHRFLSDLFARLEEPRRAVDSPRR